MEQYESSIIIMDKEWEKRLKNSSNSVKKSVSKILHDNAREAIIKIEKEKTNSENFK